MMENIESESGKLTVLHALWGLIRKVKVLIQ